MQIIPEDMRGPRLAALTVTLIIVFVLGLGLGYLFAKEEYRAPIIIEKYS